MIDPVDPHEFAIAVRKLRSFFDKRGFVEGHFQHRLEPLGILAACENPFNIATFNYAGQVWPLPQTSQMWMEYELLTNPDVPGYFCISTSFRQEPDPVEGRHNLIFPMFEFETHGDMETLAELEKDLLEHLGFGSTSNFPEILYDDAMLRYDANEIGDAEEKALYATFGDALLLTRFPNHTWPFWNMKRDGKHAKKIDVILFGVETIGSSERSSDPEEMRHYFYTISDGAYAKTLFGKFTRERVERELDFFLSLPFITRCGGGMGMTRMIRALKLAGQI
ncbi:transposase [Patescibacteria group bacterium]|nr:transposase [Patescibacteria group bacterium]